MKYKLFQILVFLLTLVGIFPKRGFAQEQSLYGAPPPTRTDQIFASLDESKYRVIDFLSGPLGWFFVSILTIFGLVLLAIRIYIKGLKKK